MRSKTLPRRLAARPTPVAVSRGRSVALHRSRVRVAAVVGLVALVVVVGLSSRAGAIAYGTLDTTHASVGAFIIYLEGRNWPGAPPGYAWCSGTLVAPRVFLTAGHCFEGILANQIPVGDMHVSFAANILEDRKSWRDVASWSRHPEFTFLSEDWHDVAVVILEKPVKDIAPAKVAPVGFLDGLAAEGRLADAQFPLVGYGMDETFAVDGSRRIGVSSFTALRETWLYTSMNPTLGDAGGCFGDSGGPKLYSDGSAEYVVAVESWGDAVCRALDIGYRVDTTSAQAFIQAAIAANS